MKLFNGIKTRFGKRKLEKFIVRQKRKARVSNFSTAHSIGLVYNIKNTDYQDFINKYIDYLREEIGFKTIVSLGFNLKETEPKFLKGGSKFKSFSKNELDWKNFPKGKEIENFCNQDFDILIDLARNYTVPLRYVVVKSKARLKIGRYSKENEKYYDFMVDISETEPVSEYIEQVNHFLNNVKPK